MIGPAKVRDCDLGLADKTKLLEQILWFLNFHLVNKRKFSQVLLQSILLALQQLLKLLLDFGHASLDLSQVGLPMCIGLGTEELELHFVELEAGGPILQWLREEAISVVSGQQVLLDY